jgi:hypothetical protein
LSTSDSRLDGKAAPLCYPPAAPSGQMQQCLLGSLLYAAESTLSLVNPAVELTGPDRVLRIGLRLGGPLLLGLALLAVRNRVKR